MPRTDAEALEQSTESPAGSQAQVGQTTQDCPKPCDSSCPKEASEAQYDKVRRPGKGYDDFKDAANARRPRTCEACLKTVPDLEPDHIVSLKAICQMPGFACLSEKDQKDVANTPYNFAGLCRSCNGSKQDKSWYEWKGVDNQPPVSPDIRKSFKAKEDRRKKVLEAKIRGKPCPKRPGSAS